MCIFNCKVQEAWKLSTHQKQPQMPISNTVSLRRSQCIHWNSWLNILDSLKFWKVIYHYSILGALGSMLSRGILNFIVTSLAPKHYLINFLNPYTTIWILILQVLKM